MPSFLLSPLLKWSLAALGGAMVVHWAVKEARRINEELENARRVKAKITDAENRPTLRRDPATGFKNLTTRERVADSNDPARVDDCRSSLRRTARSAPTQ
jgi:hypothetical protein